MRQRFLILTSIVLGSLAAGLFFRQSILPRAKITDEEAKRFGYSSSEDQLETTANFKKYWADIVANGRLDGWEYQLAKETLDHGSFAAQTRIVVAIGYLRGDFERQRALKMMPVGSIDPRLYGVWMSSFRRWMGGKGDEAVLRMLEASANPNAVKIEDELRGAENAKN